MHPLVAPLTEAVVLDQNAGALVVPRAALAAIVSRASGLSVDEKRTVASDLIALAKTVWKHRGRLNVEDALETMAVACAQILGDVQRATDMLTSAGMSALGAAIGRRKELRAPRAADAAALKAAAQTVRPARGLQIRR